MIEFPGGASRLAALLIAHICPICSLFAPRHPGAALRDLGKSSRFQGTSDSSDSKRAYGYLSSFAREALQPPEDDRLQRDSTIGEAVVTLHGCVLERSGAVLP